MSEYNFRQERITKLLKELRYEVERGMMTGEIDERLHYTFIVPRSKAGGDTVVRCEFRTWPMDLAMVDYSRRDAEPDVPRGDAENTEVSVSVPISIAK